jgi:hypothetical protein
MMTLCLKLIPVGSLTRGSLERRLATASAEKHPIYRKAYVDGAKAGCGVPHLLVG